MFTGIIEELGHVRSVEQRGDNARILIEARLVTEDIQEGDSIAVNGVCLTALNVEKDFFAADVSRETLDRSTLGRLLPGAPVNLERSVTPATRLGGHLVQGHVDGVGTVECVAMREDARLLDLRVPQDVALVSVPLGSITVDGVSLTVNAIPAPGVIQISLIPFTLQHTTLGERQAGDRVHLEADTIGKYVAQLLRARGDLGAS